MEFNTLMPVISLLLTVVLVSIYFTAQHTFIGLMISVWLIFALGLANIPTIPAQVSAAATLLKTYLQGFFLQALHLFPGEYSYVVVGSIGLAESFTFATLGVINKVQYCFITFPT